MTISETSMNSSSSIIKVSEIGMTFGKEYYTVLSREPSRLHLFYAKNSTLLHADENDLDTPIVVGYEAIEAAVSKNSFLGARFIIGSIDCHPSLNGGILVNVLGQIQSRQSSSQNRNFVQTFFLAEQPAGYFILNDNLRFLNQNQQVQEVTEPAVTRDTPIQSAPIAAEQVIEQVIEPVIEPAVITDEPATLPVTSEVAVDNENCSIDVPTPKIKKITSAAKRAAVSGASSVAAPSSPVEEELPAGPSSWAQLAAVQQNKWATGVVASTKGTSIQSEEKPKTVNVSSGRKDTRKINNSNSSAAAVTATSSISNNTNNDQKARITSNELPSSFKSSGKLPFVPEASLYITGVTSALKSDAIRAEFAALGTLAHFDVKYNSNAAFVEYLDPAIAKLVLEEGSIVVNGVRLNVEKRRIASRNNNNIRDLTGVKDSTKKFTATKSNRRDRAPRTSVDSTTA